MLTLGIDEVGRGAWAGPMAVGAVVLDSENTPIGLADSKKLTKKKREKLVPDIKKSAIAIGIGWATAPEIDKLGLSKSLKLAAVCAIKQIPSEIYKKVDQIVIDGTVRLIEDPRVVTLIKADSKIAAVSAGAIIAKVARDNYMAQLDKVFPDYEFARHVGYGTGLHQNKLRNFGAIAGIHRQSFAPIAALSKSPAASSELIKKVDKTIGRVAENVAAKYLEKLGHHIIAQNWRMKFCEIDIVSEQDRVLYFTEVKFRENARHGNGLDAITPKKLKQMRRAAEFFLAKHAEFTNNYDIQISAISLSKNPPQIDEFIENII